MRKGGGFDLAAAALEGRPAEVLAGAGADAWQAYNAMETTKRRHFELLETLDLKRRNYNIEPSEAETRRLGWLLADHDAQVARFTAASAELRSRDADAHAALFAYVGAIAAGTAPADAAPRTH